MFKSSRIAWLSATLVGIGALCFVVGAGAINASAQSNGPPALWGTAISASGEPMEGGRRLGPCRRRDDDHIGLHRRAGAVLLSGACATVRSRDLSGVGPGRRLRKGRRQGDARRDRVDRAGLHAHAYRRFHASAVRHRMARCASRGDPRRPPDEGGFSSHLHRMPPGWSRAAEPIRSTWMADDHRPYGPGVVPRMAWSELPAVAHDTVLPERARQVPGESPRAEVRSAGVRAPAAADR